VTLSVSLWRYSPACLSSASCRLRRCVEWTTLIRLELALKNFALIHRSKRSKLMISAVRILLEGARTRLRVVVADKAEGWRTHQVPFRDTQPAA